MEAMKLSLAAMANELGHSMQDAISDTGMFQEMLDKSFDKLSRIDDEGLSLEDTMGILRDLVRESRDVRMSTMHFRNQLSNAEKEIKELRTALNETRKLANEDALTNLLNRRAFDLELEGLIRSQQPFSLIMADIDRFKSFNDEYGHLLGDQVLRAFSKRLRDACKDGVTAYRLGGEEFAMLVPHRALALARQMAESMRRAIETDVDPGSQIGAPYRSHHSLVWRGRVQRSGECRRPGRAYRQAALQGQGAGSQPGDAASFLS